MTMQLQGYKVKGLRPTLRVLQDVSRERHTSVLDEIAHVGDTSLQETF